MKDMGTRLIAANCGSGQRKFTSTPEIEWINLDINPKWEPDVVGDWRIMDMFAEGSMDLVVSHHSLEHVGCGEHLPFIAEAYRVLKVGGSLLVFVPDLRALAQRWLLGLIDDYTYLVNVYGAYMGDEADRHKWSITRAGLMADTQPLFQFKNFDYRDIPGADLSRDWWINSWELVKK